MLKGEREVREKEGKKEPFLNDLGEIFHLLLQLFGKDGKHLPYFSQK